MYALSAFMPAEGFWDGLAMMLLFVFADRAVRFVAAGFLRPVAMLFLDGWVRIGGWGGRENSTICAAVTGTDAYLWTGQEGREKCTDVLSKRVYSMALTFATAVWGTIVSCLVLRVVQRE